MTNGDCAAGPSCCLPGCRASRWLRINILVAVAGADLHHALQRRESAGCCRSECRISAVTASSAEDFMTMTVSSFAHTPVSTGTDAFSRLGVVIPRGRPSRSRTTRRSAPGAFASRVMIKALDPSREICSSVTVRSVSHWALTATISAGFSMETAESLPAAVTGSGPGPARKDSTLGPVSSLPEAASTGCSVLADHESIRLRSAVEKAKRSCVSDIAGSRELSAVNGGPRV